jgi:hypothetical protein
MVWIVATPTACNARARYGIDFAAISIIEADFLVGQLILSWFSTT